MQRARLIEQLQVKQQAGQTTFLFADHLLVSFDAGKKSEQNMSSPQQV